MERYRAIKKLAVCAAELIEQVQFDDHQGKPEKAEPLLKEIMSLCLQISEKPETLCNLMKAELIHQDEKTSFFEADTASADKSEQK